MFDFKSFTDNLATTLNALTPRITVPFAATAWILLYIHTHGIMSLPSGVIVSTLIVGVLCTCLAVGSFIAYLWIASSGVREHFAAMLRHSLDKKRIQAELDYLTPQEREIIAYLLAKQQRVFEVRPDGEQAATLIAKGFVIWTIRKPPAIHRDITVEIPLHVWGVLVKNRTRFPYEAAGAGTVPWRTHWTAR